MERGENTVQQANLDHPSVFYLNDEHILDFASSVLSRRPTYSWDVSLEAHTSYESQKAAPAPTRLTRRYIFRLYFVFTLTLVAAWQKPMKPSRIYFSLFPTGTYRARPTNMQQKRRYAGGDEEDEGDESSRMASSVSRMWPT